MTQYQTPLIADDLPTVVGVPFVIVIIVFGVLVIAATLLILARGRQRSNDPSVPQSRRGRKIRAFGLAHQMTYEARAETPFPGGGSGSPDVRRPVTNLLTGLWRGIRVRFADTENEERSDSVVIVPVRRDVPRLALEYVDGRWGVREGTINMGSGNLQRWLANVPGTYRFNVRNGMAMTSCEGLDPEKLPEILDRATEFVLHVV